MSIVKPFRGLRPDKDFTEKIASPPYDVLNSEEARERVKDNPYSFLHIVKPEIDLERGVDLYDDSVYEKAKENFKAFIDKKWMIMDQIPCFYLYKQVMGGHSQIGLVAGASVEEYERDLIKKHEFTRRVKEDDRTKHVMALKANTGPVFLTYHASEEIDRFVENFIEVNKPENDFISDDGIRHSFWVVKENEDIEKIIEIFKSIPLLYVADGHHRSAAATRAMNIFKEKNPSHSGDEEYNFFLTVIFPHNQMKIMDYNRVVKDLNDLSKEEFLNVVKSKFSIEKCSSDDIESLKPKNNNKFLMYLDSDFYFLTAREGTWDKDDPVNSLDVSILQDNLLSPILGIGNPREDTRIDFVGGIRGIGELTKLVDSGKFEVAFAFHPVSIEQLMRIADTGNVMPPKSTWFEPKLRSGLVVHLL